MKITKKQLRSIIQEAILLEHIDMKSIRNMILSADKDELRKAIKLAVDANLCKVSHKKIGRWKYAYEAEYLLEDLDQEFLSMLERTSHSLERGWRKEHYQGITIDVYQGRNPRVQILLGDFQKSRENQMRDEKEEYIKRHQEKGWDTTGWRGRLGLS